jgi:hypothetical protein
METDSFLLSFLCFIFFYDMVNQMWPEEAEKRPGGKKP